jgi:hypothetical protein
MQLTLTKKLATPRTSMACSGTETHWAPATPPAQTAAFHTHNTTLKSAHKECVCYKRQCQDDARLHNEKHQTGSHNTRHYSTERQSSKPTLHNSTGIKHTFDEGSKHQSPLYQWHFTLQPTSTTRPSNVLCDCVLHCRRGNVCITLGDKRHVQLGRHSICAMHTITREVNRPLKVFNPSNTRQVLGYNTNRHSTV